MDFSLVFASRGRVDLLEGLFRSIQETTSVPELVEVIPVIDDDDQITQESVYDLISFLPGFSVSFLSRPRSRLLNEDYINFGSRRSKGKYIFILNDDVIFKTPGWDKKVSEKLNKYLSNKSDRIVYGMTDDGMDQLRAKQGLQYTGFPIISRESFEALGYAMHPSFASWGADIDLFTVYNAISRVCDLKSEVLAFHLSPHTNTRESDEINQHVASISTQRRDQSTIQNDINRLNSYIYKNNPSGLSISSIVVEPIKPELPPPPQKNPVTERYLKRMSSAKRKN